MFIPSSMFMHWQKGRSTVGVCSKESGGLLTGNPWLTYCKPRMGFWLDFYARIA